MNIDLEYLHGFILDFLEISTFLLVFCFGIGILLVLYMYLSDVLQTEQAVRRNYPVIGRFRTLFEKLGEFFRQYFFAMDREEMPFNRAQREWIYKASANKDDTVAFGSTLHLYQPGTFILLNHPFPVQDTSDFEPQVLSFGAGYARIPFSTTSRFNISGMSYGAISTPAVRALSKGAAKAGIWLNTGEGGLSSYHLEGGCDLVFQIGTARYGVRDEQGNLCDQRLAQLAEHEQVKMFEIKLSQGAKPGKGGILPAAKVNPEIAAIRNIPVYQDSISPNGQPGVSNNQELLQLIAHVREITGKPCGIKLVLGQKYWIDELCQCIVEMGPEYAPDFITLDSADGGTGAAPSSLIDHMGLPLLRSLPYMLNRLESFGLRERVKVICSGKLVNPAQIAGILCMGADAIVSARGFMFALGCIQSLKCNKNTCPTGITTHDVDLQAGLVVKDKAERVNQYARHVNHELNMIAHSCGVQEPALLNKHHAHIVDEHGTPVPLETLFSTID